MKTENLKLVPGADPVLINVKGFSLIELLFAMLFLSVIVFGVVKLQTGNLTLSNTKNLEAKAYFIATQGLQIVQALGHSAVDEAYDCSDFSACDCQITGSTPNYGFNCQGMPEVMGDIEFQRSFIVEPRPADQDLFGSYLVTSQVEWTDSSGEHEVSVKRIITN